MTYDFDEIIPRKGTDSIKYDRMTDVCAEPDALPMWVADMDFRTPPFIMRTIQNRLDQGILGYTCRPKAYYESICRWNKEQYGVDIAPEMICYIPGVVAGIFLSLQAFTEKNDRILIMEPVYHPFRLVPQACGRIVETSPLRRTEESFEIDMARLKEDIKGCRMLIICNPHNPAGICWSKETLQEVAHICYEEGVYVISDEIHCDMLLQGRKHIPFASVSEEAKKITITLQAPTKTYNLPGVVAAHAVVHDAELRERLFGYIIGCDMDLGNVLAGDCVQACYSAEGLEWKTQMLDYVQRNIDHLCQRMAAECPRIRPIRPQASFLVFLDCREMGFETQKELEQFFASEAHIAMNSGEMFGASGIGYMRMNMACPRAILDKAIDQIVAAAKKIG